MNNRNIILILILIIAAAAALLYMDLGTMDSSRENMPAAENGKLNTYMLFSSDTPDGNHSTEFILMDMKHRPITNQNVTISYKLDNQNRTSSASTDSNGYFNVSLDGNASDVIIRYAGDATHNPCEHKIT